MDTNDGKMAKDACDAVRSVVGDDVWDRVKNPLPGSDDFAGIAERIPSVYFLLCTNNIEKSVDTGAKNRA